MKLSVERGRGGGVGRRASRRGRRPGAPVHAVAQSALHQQPDVSQQVLAADAQLPQLANVHLRTVTEYFVYNLGLLSVLLKFS